MREIAQDVDHHPREDGPGPPGEHAVEDRNQEKARPEEKDRPDPVRDMGRDEDETRDPDGILRIVPLDAGCIYPRNAISSTIPAMTPPMMNIDQR